VPRTRSITSYWEFFGAVNPEVAGEGCLGGGGEYGGSHQCLLHLYAAGRVIAGDRVNAHLLETTLPHSNPGNVGCEGARQEGEQWDEVQQSGEWQSNSRCGVRQALHLIVDALNSHMAIIRQYIYKKHTIVV
jgi:hypothetical protein